MIASFVFDFFGFSTLVLVVLVAVASAGKFSFDPSVGEVGVTMKKSESGKRLEGKMLLNMMELVNNNCRRRCQCRERGRQRK